MINNRPFIDHVMQAGDFKTCWQMHEELKISHSTISRVMNNKIHVSAEFILAVHEYLGVPVCEMRELLGERK